MKERIIYSLEILVSLLVVVSLLWVAFYVKPRTEVASVEAALFGYRNNFYGVTVADETGSIVWAVGTGGRIIRSGDGGETWTLQSAPTANNLQDIAAWDEHAALVVGDEGTVLVTGDGGQTWTQTDVPLREFGEQLLQAYVEKGTDRAWVAGTFGTLFQSLDRGATWKMVHPEIDVAWNDVTVAPDGTVWVVGEFGTMRRSNDSGETWEDVEVETESSLMSIAFADATHGVIVGLSGTVAHTMDGGQSWNIVPAGIESHLFDVSWTGSAFAAVGDAGMAGTADRSGLDWTFSRIAENNFSWYTASAAAGPSRLYISGANLGVLEDGTWRPFQEQNRR
jgi:photosystem II stability/assembly factor-like uncharacterized protein